MEQITKQEKYEKRVVKDNGYDISEYFADFDKFSERPNSGIKTFVELHNSDYKDFYCGEPVKKYIVISEVGGFYEK